MEKWVSVLDRLPTEADADKGGCVLVWHIHQGVLLMGWHQVTSNRFFSHWMRAPMPPEGAERLRTEWVDGNGRRKNEQ